MVGISPVSQLVMILKGCSEYCSALLIVLNLENGKQERSFQRFDPRQKVCRIFWKLNNCFFGNGSISTSGLCGCFSKKRQVSCQSHHPTRQTAHFVNRVFRKISFLSAVCWGNGDLLPSQVQKKTWFSVAEY